MAAVPRISIVIPCFNAVDTIERTLESVCSQVVRPHEVVVQDGGSTDGTLELLDRFSPLLKVESRPDSGQSEAFNRGVSRASGEIIGWLNADDIYARDALQLVGEAFARDPSVDVVFGDWAMIDGDGEQLRRYYLHEWDWVRVIRRGLHVFSGATFFRRQLFDDYGLLDTHLHCAMDLEFMLRVGRSTRWLHLPYLLGSFRVGGESKTGSIGRQFVVEAHNVRMRYSKPSPRLYLYSLISDIRETVLFMGRPIRWSKTWSRLRATKNL